MTPKPHTEGKIQTAVRAAFSVTCSGADEFFALSSFGLWGCPSLPSFGSAAFFAAFAKLNAGLTVALAGGEEDLRGGGPRVVD